MGVPAVMKIRFKELSIYPTDHEGNISYNTDNMQANRCIQLFRFYIAVNIAPYENHKEYLKEKRKLQKEATGIRDRYSTTELKNSPSKDRALAEADLDSEYERLKDADFYFLFPLDATFYMRTVHDFNRNFFEKPQRFIRIHLTDPLIILANNRITEYLTSLNHHLKVMKVAQENLHLRPLEAPSENLRGWWKYAIRAINEDIKRNKSFTQSSAQNWVAMMNYVSLYKRKQEIVQSFILYP